MINKNYALSYSETTPVLYRCHVLHIGCHIIDPADKSAENSLGNILPKTDSNVYRIVFVRMGSGRIMADGKWWTFGNDSMLLFRPGESPEYECTSGTAIYWLAVHIAPINVFDRIFRIPKANLFSVSDSEKMAAYFQNILDEAAVSPAQPLLLSVLTGAVLAKMACCMEPVIPGKPLNAKDTESYIQMIIDDITKNYMLNTPISEYAAGVSLNKGYLIESFKKTTGLTPLQFRIRLRVEKAKVMLTETTLPIHEIAALIGYTDSLYFSKQFAGYTGMSPIAYRKQYQ